MTLNNLGNAYGSLGDHATKKSMLERALRIKKTYYGSDHIEVAMTLNNLGGAYGSLGDHATKKSMLERALRIKKTYYGSDHIEVAMTLNNLGNANAYDDHVYTGKELLSITSICIVAALGFFVHYHGHDNIKDHDSWMKLAIQIRIVGVVAAFALVYVLLSILISRIRRFMNKRDEIMASGKK
eukprot:PhF_6_TR22068/c0_g1_i1/m.31307